MREPSTLAMFPLGTVLFPGGVLPLHVFEPRYRMLIRTALEGDSELGIVLIERGHEVGGGDTRFSVACLARIVQSEELPDGRFAVAVVGLEPLDVLEWLPDDPYPMALVAGRATTASDPEERAAARTALEGKLDELVRVLGSPRQPGDRAPTATLPNDDDVAAWMLGEALGLGPLDRQGLLAAPDASARLALLAELVDDRIMLARSQLDDPRDPDGQDD
jgi:Lon protease-like protein